MIECAGPSDMLTLTPAVWEIVVFAASQDEDDDVHYGNVIPYELVVF